MTKQRLIEILNDDEIIVTGVAHHKAIEKRVRVSPSAVIEFIVYEMQTMDEFHKLDDDLALFTGYLIFYEVFITKNYENLFQTHRDENPRRYPL